MAYTVTFFQSCEGPKDFCTSSIGVREWGYCGHMRRGKWVKAVGCTGPGGFQ